MISFDPATNDDLRCLNTTGVLQNVAGGAELAWVQWAKPAATNQTMMHVSNGLSATDTRFLTRLEGFAPFRLRFDGRALDGDAESINGAGVLDTALRHLAVCPDFSAADGDFYIDGAAVGTGVAFGAMTAGNTSNTAPVQVRMAEQNGSAGMEGLMEDARIYNRQLSADEISTIHACRGTDGIWDGCTLRLFMAGVPGAAVTGDPDWTNNNRPATVGGSPVYAESYVRRVRKAA